VTLGITLSQIIKDYGDLGEIRSLNLSKTHKKKKEITAELIIRILLSPPENSAHKC
jgi:hypothetical protein